MSEIRRLQGREQESLLELYAVITMAHGLEPLHRRLKTIPNGMRTLGQLRWASRKLLDDVMTTIPTEQLAAQKRNLEHLGYQIGVFRADGKPAEESGRWISNKCTLELINVFREHCMLCDKDFDGQCKCTLRKAFDEFPVDLPEGTRGCPYYALWGMEV